MNNLDKIKKLANQSLKIKWSKKSVPLGDLCAFCKDTMTKKEIKNEERPHCNQCLCPELLCSGSDYSLNDVINEYEPVSYSNNPDDKEIFENLINLMRKSLTELAKNGVISKETELEVKQCLDNATEDIMSE